MNISNYISQLLFEHDCVIIPGFGGFVCNYKPASVNYTLQTITPPAKSISFNRNLRSNDGLLINHIATNEKITFDEAFIAVYSWVSSSNSLLTRQEEVVLNKVGVFQNNTEGILQFIPDESVNYLKSSFGLKTISAAPVVHSKTIHLNGSVAPVAKEIKPQKNIWRIAAAILLIAAMSTVITLMQMGIEIKPLNINEANMLGFVNNVLKTNEPELKPIPVEVPTPAVVEKVVAAPEEKTVAVSPTAISSAPAYYVIIGAFSEQKNVEKATATLKQKHNDTDILVERNNGLTRVGYYAGNKFYAAIGQLKTAQKEDNTFWLMKK